MSNLARLDRERKKYGITQDSIAAACVSPKKPRGVDRTMVNKVLNGKAKSARVVAVIERLILEAKLRAVAS